MCHWAHFPTASLNLNCCNANTSPKMYKQYSKSPTENKTTTITELT